MEITLPRKERRKLERRLDKAKRRGKMKLIKYTPEFLAASGQPFSVIDPNASAQKKAREDAKKEGKDRFDVPTIDCDFAQAMCWFVNNIPFQTEPEKDGKEAPLRKLTPEDTGNAYAVIKAFRNPQNGYVELENSVYNWLVELNKADGVTAFRITQAVVAERLLDIKPEAKPKE